jgi:hypothetical protein
MRRPLIFRLGTALAAIVFAATGGVVGMDAHPLPSHEADGAALVPPQAALASQAAAHAVDDTGHHGGHHSGRDDGARDADHGSHEQAAPAASHGGHHEGHHPPGQECTCVGPCQGGAAPSLSGPETSALPVVEPDRTPVEPAVARLIPQDPRSHLLPPPTAPPARV